MGNSGFDYKTAADFLNGKTVSDEAVRKFVATSRWAHDERAALSATLLAMHGVLTSREAEIALLKKALLEAEAAPGELSADSLRHQNKLLAETLGACILASGIVRKDIDGFTGPELLHFGEDLRSMLEAAPQQVAQEPVAWLNPWRADQVTTDYDAYGERGIPLYTAPQPAPAPLSEMPYEKRKAIQEGEQISASDAWFHARINMLDTLDRRNVFRAGFDRGWSAALAAQGGK